MAKKANGNTEIELEILNPEKFQTLQEIRDFVTGDGASALHFAIAATLSPGVNPIGNGEREYKLETAREGAFSLNRDLAALAKAAVELEEDPHVSSDRQVGPLDDDRRALMFVALRNGEAMYPIQWEIIQHLGGADTGTAHA